MKTEYTITAADALAIECLYDILIECLDWNHMTQQEKDTTQAGSNAIFRLFQQRHEGS